jgi:hypothetical protein
LDSKQIREFVVSGIRYDSNRCRVYRVRVHRVRAGSVDPPMNVPRSVIVNALELGATFTAITLSDGGRYTPHAPIGLVNVGGEWFLRCDTDQLPADDLVGVLEF